ncbi:MAG: alanine/ornithine racemase family PLP-dependent enzyme [Eubacteriales bacterium]|nr:alanine/ornithine racemase family PLP-dependent enzyme [Eubacteriales bacterium]MDD4078406.1 alanine/ornithine racemase family PLP-dependent enzyme [Eubacteriales bacterium]MDD4768221.1 alanine/ornithine racemase family PLP-dependent enzyme [Eubacteriales bacterium]
MYPKLIIDLKKLKENSQLLANLCFTENIEPVGVTKVTCGDPKVARAMMAGGIRMLAESRVENARRLKTAGIDAPLLLLRLPMLSQVDAVVELFQCSLNSELATIRALDAAAAKAGVVHEIILMLDLGDLREGVLPGQLEEMVLEIAELKNIRLLGLGTNLTCYGGVIPTWDNLGQLLEYNRKAEKLYSHLLPVISGGNSSSLPLLLEGHLPPVTQLRLGESIVLGRETVDRQPIPGAHLDCFQIQAEIIEIRKKPSVPIGKIGQDAFGGTPVFEDRGIHLRAILALGRQDVVVDGLETPEGIDILGASSDHLLLDVTKYPKSLAVGDVLTFTPGYGALLAAMTSAFVTKEYRQ